MPSDLLGLVIVVHQRCVAATLQPEYGCNHMVVIISMVVIIRENEKLSQTSGGGQWSCHNDLIDILDHLGRQFRYYWFVMFFMNLDLESVGIVTCS